MKYKMVFRKKAGAHLLEIHEWYESQKQGLGDEFFLSINASLASVLKSPLLFQVKFKNIRCAIVSRFPYGIYYSIESDRIVILSVIHFKRKPKLTRKS
jgi:hypothetical protein